MRIRPPGASEFSRDGSMNVPSGAKVMGCDRTNVHDSASGISGAREQRDTLLQQKKNLPQKTFRELIHLY